MKRVRFSDIILYEDQHYLVINKPPGLSTLDDRNEPKSVLSWSRKYYPQSQVCHRLDKHTSGVLVLSKDPEAYRKLSMQFEQRSVKKVYHAVVQGKHQFQQRQVQMELKMGRRGTVHVVPAGGKESITVFDTLDVFKMHSLVRCEPITGRTHQIRVHLSQLGAPIVGDLSYGGQQFFLSQIKTHYNLKRYTEERPLISRMALHAQALEFQLFEGKPAHFEAPYAKDFQVLLKQLDKNRAVNTI